MMRGMVVYAVAVLAGVSVARAGTCPNPPEPGVTAESPADVCIPAGFTGLSIDFFDDYSWRTFTAMVWPAAARGVADLKKTPGGAGPPVFETFRALWEVFHEDGSAPGAFDSENPASSAKNNACASPAAPGRMVLASFSGINDIGQTADGSLTGPLAAQNGRYVRYLTAYNALAYSHIVSNQWYRRDHLPEVPVPRPPVPPVQFPDGSMVVKSAWVEMAGFSAEQQKRYYTRTALVRDPDSGKCATTLVGLIGLHIVRKTASRPQWIWSSFEQVDNVPPADPGSEGHFTLHDGTPAPMPAANPLSLIPLAKQPVTPFNVERSAKAPIHPKTAATNAKYRKLLAGTVWRNYQLVLTQWPLAPGDQSLPVAASQAGDIFQTFPGEAAVSAFANVTMETFNQTRPAQGCMNCHNRARLGADFMWSVLMHAYPASRIGLR